MNCCNECGNSITLFSGSPGLSAYELAVANGYVGTESQWLASLERDYSKYTALLSQTSTNAPTAVVLGDNTIGSIVWTRTSTGVYKGTLTGAFTSKTWLYINSGIGNAIEHQISRTNVNEILIQSYAAGVPTDALLNETSLEIRIYP